MLGTSGQLRGLYDFWEGEGNKVLGKSQGESSSSEVRLRLARLPKATQTVTIANIG